MGPDLVLEVGPGKVLSGLLRRISREVPTRERGGWSDLGKSAGTLIETQMNADLQDLENVRRKGDLLTTLISRHLFYAFY